MRDNLKRAAGEPYFKLTLMLGVNGLIEAARVLSSIGIDVNALVEEALKSINSQLTDAAYEMTDLDGLLKEAQAIGDDVVQIPEETSEGGRATPKTEDGGNSSKGNLREPE